MGRDRIGTWRAPASSTVNCCAGASSAPRALGPRRFLIDRVAADLGERHRRGAAPVRARGRSRHADRRGAARAAGQRDNVGTIVAATPHAGLLDDAFPRVAADEEALPFADGSLDLVVSALALQFVNDLPGTLIQIRRALKPDGLLLAALIGGDSLSELREAFAEAESEIEGGISPRVAPFADVARTRRAVATRRLCAAGGRQRPADRALRFTPSR